MKNNDTKELFLNKESSKNKEEGEVIFQRQSYVDEVENQNKGCCFACFGCNCYVEDKAKGLPNILKQGVKISRKGKTRKQE